MSSLGILYEELGTYQGIAASCEHGLVSWRAGIDLSRAVGGGLAAQPELLACGVHLHVVDGRGGADGHDAEGRRVVLRCLGYWSRGGDERKSERSDKGLHLDGLDVGLEVEDEKMEDDCDYD